ncbi:hypothetical protein J3458_012832 [Metarhizium acridum]|uniref:uncharacterized protein n=1 Tax=Metarhizium acridum TaxID=92637 RepID=UPI001C6BC142|nr:hypothetical protein J3458_012832 [Metarhizium acridum]
MSLWLPYLHSSKSNVQEVSPYITAHTPSALLSRPTNPVPTLDIEAGGHESFDDTRHKRIIAPLSRHYILSNWYGILSWSIYRYLFGSSSSQQLTTLIEKSVSQILSSTCQGSFCNIEDGTEGTALLLTLASEGELSQQYICVSRMVLGSICCLSSVFCI